MSTVRSTPITAQIHQAMYQNGMYFIQSANYPQMPCVYELKQPGKWVQAEALQCPHESIFHDDSFIYNHSISIPREDPWNLLKLRPLKPNI